MVDVDSESHHSFKFVAPRKDGANWKGKVQNLKELCLDVLMKNRRQLRKVGKAPYWLMKPIYDKLEPNELEELEKHNPGLKEDTMELWKKHCIVQFSDDFSNYNVPDQDWRALFLMQKVEEAQRLVRARERLRISTQEHKKTRKVKLINHINLPPVKRHGGWVKLTPLQKEIKKTLRSGACERRTHFTQLESGPTMMTVPEDWLQGRRVTSEPVNRPVQVILRTEKNHSSVREVDRNYPLQTPNRKITSGSCYTSTRRMSTAPPSNKSAPVASVPSSTKRVRVVETTAPLTKRARVELSKPSGVVSPEKARISKLTALKKTPASSDVPKTTLTGSRRLETTAISKSDGTLKSKVMKPVKTIATTTNDTRKTWSIKKDVRHEPYRTKKQRVRNDY